MYSIVFVLVILLFIFMSGLLLNIATWVLFPFWVSSVSLKYIFAFSILYFYILTLKTELTK